EPVPPMGTAVLPRDPRDIRGVWTESGRGVAARLRVAQRREDLLGAIGEYCRRFVERYQARQRRARGQPGACDERDGDEGKRRRCSGDGPRAGFTSGDQQFGGGRFTGGEGGGKRVAAGQRDRDGDRRCRPLLGVARQAAHDPPFHRRIEVAHDRRRRDDGPGVVQLLQVADRLGVVGPPAGEDLEQDQAEGVDVALRRRRLAGQQLRRHVLRRAGERRAAVGGRGGDPEVGDADVAVAVEHDVGRLEVAVNDAALVRGGDAGAQLAGDVDRLVRREDAEAAEQRREILAVDILHGQEAAAVGVAQVVEAADVLVGDLAGDAQLVVELGEARGVGGGPLGQELERNRLVEGEVVGAVDLAHAAAAEQRDQAIARRDHRPGRKPRRAGGRRQWRRADGDVEVGHDRDSTVVRHWAEFVEEKMTRTLIASGAVALMLTAGLFAQGGRRLPSPAGTAATEIGGKYDTSGAEPVYKGGKWIEITHGRPIKRGRDVFGGTGDKYGKVANPD